ncbi:MAG: hypothetical protein IT373_29360 [Polyangiaceae bacterium]|nr:hypothetical protein [Polyangiaceae bacterium]
MLEIEVVPTAVPPEQRVCPHCENAELRTVGDGKPSVIYDYVAPHFRKRVHLRETLASSCGQYVVTAPPPERVGNKTQYVRASSPTSSSASAPTAARSTTSPRSTSASASR